MFDRTQLTTLFELFGESMYHFKVIIKKVLEADNNYNLYAAGG